MAFLLACADGTLTSSSTWRTVDSSYVLGEGAIVATAVTTSYTTSSNFSPGAIEVDAIALKFFTPGASGNTLTISLYDVTSSSEVVAVAVPTADLSPGTNTNGSRAGWQLFSLGANYLLEAGKNYAIRLKISAGTAPTVAYLTSATNWYHFLRTTTNAAPSSGDSCLILGLWTSSGTWTQYTVTVDTTSTSPTFGATPSGTYWEERNQGIYVARSTLTWPTTSSTTLSITGGLRCHAYGKVTCGTTGSPIVRGTNAVIYLVSGTGNNVNVQEYSTFSICGESPASSVSTNHATLVVGATSGSTASLQLSTATYWTSGSRVVIASATYNDYDKQQATTVSADATTESLSLTAAVTHNFPGSSGTYAGSELFMYNHNARFELSTTAFQPYCTVWQRSTVIFSWAGMSQTAWEWGAIATGSLYADKCGWYFSTTAGNGNSAIKVGGSGANGSVFMRDLWTNNPAGGASGWAWYISVTGSAPENSWTADGIYFAAKASGVGGHYFTHGKHWAALRKLRSYCGAGGLSGNDLESAGWQPSCSDYLADTLVVGSSNNQQFTVPQYLRDHTFYRLALVSAFHILNFSYSHFNLTFQDCAFLGSTSYRIIVDSANTRMRNIVFSSCSIGSYGANAPTNFWIVNGSYSGLLDMKFLGCVGSNSYTAACTGSMLQLGGVGDSQLPVEMRIVVSPDFGNWAAVPVSLTGNPAYFNKESFVSFHNFKGVSGDHRIYKPRLPDGTTSSSCPLIQTDSTVYNTAAPSEKITPLTTASKLESTVKRFAVASGSTASVGVYVYKSAAYNGAQPRLIIRRNDPMGYIADTVGATMTTGTGAWENLTTTIAAATADGVLEVVVDCDGTTGSIYVDDWSAT